MSEIRIALVTGGGGGIGSAISRALIDAGAHVLVAGRSFERCAAVAEELGRFAAPLALDVTEPRSIASAMLTTGRVDWLVNNAGFVESAPIERLIERPGRPDSYERHMAVNFHGARRVFEACLPGMLSRGYGRVVQVASSAALAGYPYVSAYVASKHALLGYTRSAALELARQGVALDVVCPHYVDSPMTDASVARIRAKTGKSEDEVRARLASTNPGGVFVTPGEVAVAVAELIEGGWTGRVLELVGGGSRIVDEGRPLPEPGR